MTDAASLITFYKQHGISPVRQDISDLHTHFTRRSALYRHLGLLPSMIRDRTVLEVGPGGGFNSLHVATLRPSRYVLLEANPTGVRDIHALFGNFPELKERIEVVQEMVEHYDTTERFDVVLCEGVLALAGVPNPVDLLRAVARFVAPGGVLVITCMDAVSGFAETLRRLVAQLLIDPGDSLSGRCEQLMPVFSPHLATLSGMSRRHDDWIVDNLLSPASIGPYLSIPNAIEGIAGEFELLSASPQFFTDWRWYKAIVPGQTRYNEIGIQQYWQNVHNLLDYRTVSAPRSIEENRRLYASCDMARNRIRQFESTRDVRLVQTVLVHVREVAQQVHGFNEDVATILAELRVLAPPFPELARQLVDSQQFAPWFGRGQQYLSFTRNA